MLEVQMIEEVGVALEGHRLVLVAQERAWGGLTERLFVATARSYIVWPWALGPVAVDRERSADRLSASYRIALAAPELTAVVTQLAAHYQHESAPGGWAHRRVVLPHPQPHNPSNETAS